MEVTMTEIDKVLPYENNPRKNDDAVEEVAKSIEAFGFKNPIIVDKNYVIIAGHTRLKAAIKLGLTHVPTIVAEDLTDEQANALRLADNKTGEISKWDRKKLDEELRKIDWNALGFEMTDFGFNDIFASDEVEVTDDDFDEGQYLPAEPYSEQGDIYLLQEGPKPGERGARLLQGVGGRGNHSKERHQVPRPGFREGIRRDHQGRLEQERLEMAGAERRILRVQAQHRLH